MIQQLTGIVKSKEKNLAPIIGSSLPFIITIVANPDPDHLDGAHEVAKSIYCRRASELMSEPCVYAFVLGFSSLTLPKGFDKVLLYVGTGEFSFGQQKS